MREILFRGKRIDNGEWIEGYFCRKYFPELPHDRCVIQYKPKSDVCKWTPPYIADEIIPETIGQYTGLTDKNGKKIFEGDIVVTKYKLGRGGYYVFEVYYNENLCQFALTINSGSYTKNKQYDWLQLTELKANKIEVIGNIHDNHELLKGEE